MCGRSPLPVGIHLHGLEWMDWGYGRPPAAVPAVWAKCEPDPEARSGGRSHAASPQSPEHEDVGFAGAWGCLASAPLVHFGDRYGTRES